MFATSTRQQRCRVKKKYFHGDISDVPTESPIEHMNDKQWLDLRRHWFDAKTVVWFEKTVRSDHIPNSYLRN